MTYVNSVIYFLLTYSHQLKISNMVTSGVSLKSLTEGIKIWHPGRKSNTRETMQTITSKVMVCLTSNKPLFRRLLDSLLAKTGTVPNKILLRLPCKSAWCLVLSETPVYFYLSPGWTASTKSLWENNMMVCGVCPGGISSNKLEKKKLTFILHKFHVNMIKHITNKYDTN